MATIASVLTETVIIGRFRARWEAKRKLSALISTPENNGEIVEKLRLGQTVTVPLMAPVADAAYDDATGFDPSVVTRLNVTSFDVSASDKRLTMPTVTAIENWLARPDLQDATINSSADAHLNRFEGQILAKLLTGTALAGGTHDVSTNDLAVALTGTMRVAAAEEEMPEPRYLVGSPAFMQKLIDSGKVTRNGDNEALVEGHLGRINGFELIEYTHRDLSDKVIAFTPSAVAGVIAFSDSRIVDAAFQGLVGEVFMALTVNGCELVQREYDGSTTTTKGVIVATISLSAGS